MVLCCCSGESHQDGTSARTKRRRWVFWLKVPAALLHRPPCADGSGRRAGTPVPTVPGQRRRVGRAASVAGPAKDWFLTALLDLIVPQHDHAVGRRATDTVRARSALGSDGRWHIFAQGVCEPRGRAVGESSQRALRERRPPSTQRCQPSARLGSNLFGSFHGAKRLQK